MTIPAYYCTTNRYLAAWFLCHHVPLMRTVPDRVRGNHHPLLSFEFAHQPNLTELARQFQEGALVGIQDYLQAWGRVQRLVTEFKQKEER